MGKQTHTDPQPLIGDVAVAVVRGGGRYLLVHRKLAEGELKWIFPGGKIEHSESSSAAAEREVLEETGVLCKAVRNIGERRHPDTRQLLTYMLCDYLAGTAQNTEPERFTSVRWLDPVSVMARLTSNLYAPVKEVLAGAAVRLEPALVVGCPVGRLPGANRFEPWVGVNSV